MARINFPKRFAEKTSLQVKVKAKHDADALTSVLIPYIAEQGIDMTVDATATTNAVTANTNFQAAEKLSEELSQKRDNLFDKVFSDHEGEVQFLKKLFRNNVSKLGEWGVTVDNRGRIHYPPDFVGRAAAVQTFITKHNSFPVGTSPLKPYLDENGISLVTNKTNTTTASTAHNDFLTQDALKEQYVEQRDTLFAPVEAHIRGIGQFLIGLFHNAPKKAGQWGFVVDDSPQADKVRDGIVKFSSTKTLQQLAIGKDIINTGSIPLKLFKGKTAAGAPIVMNPGDKFTIVRGYGTSTLKDESATQDGTYEATFLK
mgnify:CR=1 FL=1